MFTRMFNRCVMAAVLTLLPIAAFGEKVTVCSPDGNLTVCLDDTDGRLTWSVDYEATRVVLPSRLGLITHWGDLTEGLHIVGSKSGKHENHYRMTRTKCAEGHFEAMRLTAEVESGEGLTMEVEFMVSNHDIAFRYRLPRQKDGKYKRMVIEKELTAFRLPDGTTTFLCPQIGPESGWERTKPSYEEDYEVDAAMNQPSKYGFGYTFPCLFKSSTLWLLI